MDAMRTAVWTRPISGGEAALGARDGTDSSERFLRLAGSELDRANRLAGLLLRSLSEAEDATCAPVRCRNRAHSAPGYWRQQAARFASKLAAAATPGLISAVTGLCTAPVVYAMQWSCGCRPAAGFAAVGGPPDGGTDVRTVDEEAEAGGPTMIKIWSELPVARVKEQVADFATLLWVVFWGNIVWQLFQFLAGFAQAGRTIRAGGQNMVQSGRDLGCLLYTSPSPRD